MITFVVIITDLLSMLTTTLYEECGNILGIELLDHIIIGDDNKYTSLKEKGLF